MNTTNNTSKLVILGLMTGILLLMAYTPLGYLNIGPLAITFNVIPVAIAAITLGPAGGAAIGAVFGMTSFLQCIGIGGSSAMGAMLFSINPFLAFVQRFVPRMLDGIVHNPHRCSRRSTLPGKICTGSGKKQGVRQYDFGIGYRKYECGSRLYCGWGNPLYRADGDRQWENRA